MRIISQPDPAVLHERPHHIRATAGPPARLTLAAQIVESKVADFDPRAFRDRYEEALLAHLKAEQAGAVREEKPAFAAPRRVINLMEALRRSIAQDQKPRPARAAQRSRRPANGREMSGSR